MMAVLVLMMSALKSLGTLNYKYFCHFLRQIKNKKILYSCPPHIQIEVEAVMLVIAGELFSEICRM